MGVRITIWEPGRHGRNAAIVVLTVLLAPLLVVLGLAAVLVTWPIRKLFPPKPLTATEMVEELDNMLGGQTDYDIDYGLQVITRCPFADERLQQLKQRVLVVGNPPCTATAVEELKMIRENARTIAAGDAT